MAKTAKAEMKLAFAVFVALLVAAFPIGCQYGNYRENKVKADYKTQFDKQLETKQKELDRATDNLNEAKANINNLADTVISLRTKQLRYSIRTVPCTVPTEPNGGEGEGGRSEPSTVDFEDIGREIVEIGKARDICAVKYNELLGYCEKKF